MITKFRQKGNGLYGLFWLAEDSEKHMWGLTWSMKGRRELTPRTVKLTLPLLAVMPTTFAHLWLKVNLGYYHKPNQILCLSTFPPSECYDIPMAWKHTYIMPRNPRVSEDLITSLVGAMNPPPGKTPTWESPKIPHGQTSCLLCGKVHPKSLFQAPRSL